MKNYTPLVKWLAMACCFLPLSLVARTEAKPVAQDRPLSFIENAGQIIDQYRKQRKDIDYKLSVPGMNVFIGNGQIHYQWNRVDNPLTLPENATPDVTRKLLEEYLAKPLHVTAQRMDVTLVGANLQAPATPQEMQQYTERYYLPQFGEEGGMAHSYNTIVYKDVYPHIDWVLYTKSGALKYDFIVHPGGNPKSIQLKYGGAAALTLKDGAITATTALGSVTEQKPFTYNQQSRQAIASSFVINNNIVSFDIAAHEGTIVIDPTINWATYYGGTNLEYGYGLAADASGNIYMGGWTTSTTNIATVGAYQTSLSTGTNQDAFIVKFNSAGVRQWGTYYGDVGADYFWSTAVDAGGNLYCAGYTGSTSGMTTTGAHQTTIGGGSDAFLAKFTAGGARIWATYYGGSSGEDWGNVTCDNTGNVYLCGGTNSTNNIATPGTYQTSLASTSQYDAFMAKFTAAGVRVWGTYYGGTQNEESWGSGCDGSGNVYMTGWTYSTSGIATTGAYQTTLAGGTYDGYIAKFDNTGNIIWGTYFGGANQDLLYDAAVDNSGNIYTSGYSLSSGLATTGAYQTTISGSYDGIVLKFSPSGGLQWCTYYGGSNLEYCWGVAVNPGGYLYFSGWTNSTNGIATTGAYQTSLAGSYDAFLVEMNSASGFPTWGTYFGGSGLEYGYGNCAWSPAGYVFISGYTQSTSGIATTGAHQTTMGGGSYDAFLASFITDTIVYIKAPYIDTLFCPGDSFKVAYGITYNFKAGNVFTVQLSDASGSFTTPVNIGSKTISVADTIKCGIPLNTPAGTGYRIRIVASNPLRTSLDDGVDIRVKPIPSNLNASNNGPLCVGNTLFLSVTTSTTGLVTYSWTGPASYSSGVQNPTLSGIGTINAGDYIVTATSQGCIAKDTTTLVVNTIPATPTVSSNSPVCPTTTLNLTSSSTTAGITYTWTGPASFSSTTQNPSISNVSSANAGTYSVTATKNGCTSPAGTTSVVVQITTPTPVAASNAPLCDGASLNLTASSISGATYEWTGPNGFTSSLQNPTINPAHTFHSGDYIVKAKLNGCYSDPDTTPVSVNIVSAIGAYASPNDTICAGTDVQFVAIASNTGPAPAYQWYKNYTAISGANSLLYHTANLVSGDVIYCTMYSIGVCTGPILVSTDTIQMTVQNITTVPAATITSNPVHALPGQQVTFYAHVVNGGPNPTYQWQLNGVNMLGAIYANWSATTLHPYDKVNCIVTSNDPCAANKIAYSDTITVNFLTSVGHTGNDKNYELYPNPNNGNFILKGYNDGAVLYIEVMNAVGQVVYTEQAAVNGTFEKQISLDSKLANGVYLLHIRNEHHDSNTRFTINK